MCGAWRRRCRRGRCPGPRRRSRRVPRPSRAGERAAEPIEPGGAEVAAHPFTCFTSASTFLFIFMLSVAGLLERGVGKRSRTRTRRGVRRGRHRLGSVGVFAWGGGLELWEQRVRIVVWLGEVPRADQGNGVGRSPPRPPQRGRRQRRVLQIQRAGCEQSGLEAKSELGSTGPPRAVRAE